MSKDTIIDWQKDSLLMARVSGRGAKVLFEQVSYQPIGENAEGRKVTAEEALHTAVAELAAKGEVTVVLSREVVEVRTVLVPRIDPDELPDVIRFQAQRQLSSMTESWALDYVMLPPLPGQEMLTALVGGISPVHLAELDRACASAGVQATRVVLRPIEIARFAVQSGKLETAGVSMILCLGEQNAELLILRDGHVVQVRGTRLPCETEQTASSLKGEIRRSLMAASPQLGDASLKQVLLISTSAVADQLDGAIAEAAGAPVTHVDPTMMLPTALVERQMLAATAPHRLAAVAGAFATESADKQTLLDFRNPKKRPPKKKNTGRYLLYGGAAAALLLAGLTWWISTSRRMDSEIAELKAQVAGKKETLELARSKVKDLGEVQKFLDSSPNWLDELAYIAAKIPASDKVLLEAPQFAVQLDGQAVITVPVRAKDDKSISAFERAVQSENHVVKGSNPAMLPQPIGGYQWRVVESINIKGRGWDPFASKPPPGVPVATASDKSPEPTDPVSESIIDSESETPEAEVTEPETTEPETTEPETTEPETTEPETTESETTEPETTEPETTESETTEPETTEPSAR